MSPQTLPRPAARPLPQNHSEAKYMLQLKATLKTTWSNTLSIKNKNSQIQEVVLVPCTPESLPFLTGPWTIPSVSIRERVSNPGVLTSFSQALSTNFLLSSPLL